MKPVVISGLIAAVAGTGLMYTVNDEQKKQKRAEMIEMVRSGEDINCPELSYQEAQFFLAASLEVWEFDYARLDKDGDGEACELNKF